MVMEGCCKSSQLPFKLGLSTLPRTIHIIQKKSAHTPSMQASGACDITQDCTIRDLTTFYGWGDLSAVIFSVGNVSINTGTTSNPGAGRRRLSQMVRYFRLVHACQGIPNEVHLEAVLAFNVAWKAFVVAHTRCTFLGLHSYTRNAEFWQTLRQGNLDGFS